MLDVEELTRIVEGLDNDVRTVIEPMLEDLVFVEGQLESLRKQPFIRYHPKDPSKQKLTPAGRLYREMLSQKKDIVRIIWLAIRNDPSTETDSPLREYLKRMGSG